MDKLEYSVKQGVRDSSIWFKHIKADSKNLNKMALNFRFLEIDFAVQSISNSEFLKAKQHFYTASLIDELRVEKMNDDLFTFGLPYICYPILSDNEDLISRYSKLRYQAWGKMKGMDENILLGKSDIWCNTVQFFMADNNIGVERNLNIIETISLKKLPKREVGLLDDYEFYTALHTGNKAKMEEVLEKLTSPKIHRKRNFNELHAQYISLPALGYAKLAWRKGIEVEVKNCLVPKELLPIHSLRKYEIPYEFLK